MELRTETITTIFNSSQPVYQGSGQFTIGIPQSSVMVVRPLSYEFRVVEAVDDDDKVVKVSLQTRVWEHSNYGNGTVIQDWTDVPRIKVPYVATMG